MPATTPAGYPYPLPTEPVAEGAQAIRNLAESITGWKAIAELDLAAAATFSAIPQTFDHLRLVWSARSAGAAVSVTIHGRFNGDTGAQYDTGTFTVSNGTLSSQQALAGAQFLLGTMPAAGSSAGYFGSGDLIIPDYARTTRTKHLHGSVFSFTPSALTLAELFNSVTAGNWRNTAAITSISLFLGSGHAFAANSRAWLYGISGA